MLGYKDRVSGETLSEYGCVSDQTKIWTALPPTTNRDPHARAARRCARPPPAPCAPPPGGASSPGTPRWAPPAASCSAASGSGTPSAGRGWLGLGAGGGVGPGGDVRGPGGGGGYDNNACAFPEPDQEPNKQRCSLLLLPFSNPAQKRTNVFSW